MGKVKSGINDLKTWCLNNGDFGKQLLEEWTGICVDNNKQYSIDKVAKASHKRFTWRCSKDTSHIWDVTVSDRTSRKVGCPYCSGRNVTDINSLKTWCLDNGTFGQQLLKEWTGQCLDDNKQYSIDKVAKASTKRFQWRCSKDTSHIWEATLANRTSCKSGCPYCSGRKVTDKNSLKTWCLNNGDFGKQIFNEWTGQCLDDNKQYTPDEISYGSSKKKFRWQCSKDTSHIWDATLLNRTSLKSGCPYCSGTKVTDENSLKAWCLNNGTFGQQILNEWTGQCLDDNRQYSIDEVAKASHKRFTWRCSKNPSHIWDTTLTNRTSLKSGCPYCNSYGTSYPEQVIYHSMKQIYPRTISRGKYKGYEFDIAIPEIHTCIEYSGLNWHIDKIDRDNEKRDLCKKHNVKFIQIYAHNGDVRSPDIYEPNFILYKADPAKQDEQIKSIVSMLLNQFRHSINEIDFPKACDAAFESSRSNVQDGINDLNTWCLNNGDFGKQILEEWTGQCEDSNRTYNTNEISYGSGKRFKWQCSKNPSHIWEAAVVTRTSYKSGCPYCSGKIATDKNSLKTWCSDNGDFGKQLLEEWTGQCTDDNKQYTPDEVTRASGKKFRWYCSKNPSHIWDATVIKRTSRKSGCPYCSRHRV